MHWRTGHSQFCLGPAQEYKTPTHLADFDFAYFDPSDWSSIRDAEIQRSLTAQYREFPWAVTNQAAVHTWFEATLGHPVSPFVSLKRAVASSLATTWNRS
nr:nucleotidyltransferase family protein [Burkholderia territorii]